MSGPDRAARPPGSTRYVMTRRGEIGARVARVIGIGLFRTFYRVRTPGREQVPATGPVLLAVNHTAFIDGPLVVAMSGRPVHVLSKAELFHGVLGFGLRSIGQIPVHRASADREALLVGLDVLGKGGVLAVFPEGSRGTGDFSDVRGGLAWLALRSGAPVVPVVCLGTARGTTTVAGLPRPRSRMAAVFGRPFTVAALDGRTAGRTALTAAEAIVREKLVNHYTDAHSRPGLT